MCRRTEEEVGPTVGLPRHRHFVGFFNVPVLAPTRDRPFYTVIPTHRPFSRLLRSRWGYGGHILDLTPQALMGAERVEPTRTLKFLLSRNLEINKGIHPRNPASCKALRIPYFQVVSYVFSRSKNTDTTSVYLKMHLE